MHFSPVAAPPRLAQLLLTAALACGPSVQAQTLVDTSAAIGVQNVLNSTGTPSGSAAMQQAQNLKSAQAQAAAQPAATPATSANPATPQKPAVVIVPLTPAQQTALATAQSNLKAGKLELARTQFEALIAQNYNNPEPHFGLALTLLAQKDDKGATFELGQFQLLAPDRYEGPYNLGVIATRAGRFDDALKLYTDAAALGKTKAPTTVQAQILDALATEQTRKADFAALATTLTDLAALRPDDNDVQYRLAKAQSLSGAGTAALPSLYALLQRQPQRVDAVKLLADIYVAQNLPSRALRELDAALSRVKVTADRSALLLHKANILAATGDTRSAVFSAQAAHIQDASNAEAFAREAELRVGRNDRAGALAAYQGAVKAAPKNAKFRTDLAALRLSMGQVQVAAQDAALALTLTPDVPTQARAQFVQGVALYRQSQFAQARPLLNSSAIAVPNADTALWLGLTNYALKDYAGAVAALSESVKQNPSPTARQNLASALLASGRYPEAEAVLRGLVTDNPKNADAWYLLGLTQRAQLREDEAKQSLKTAMNLGHARAKEALK